MSSLTEASTSNALRPNLDNSLTSRIPMRFALQYSIASHNTGRSSFFFAPEMCSSKTLQTSIPLYFAYSDKFLMSFRALSVTNTGDTSVYYSCCHLCITAWCVHHLLYFLYCQKLTLSHSLLWLLLCLQQQEWILLNQSVPYCLCQ